MTRATPDMPRLSWFRFRLRSVILLVAGIAVLLCGARLLQSLTLDVEANAWVGWSQAEFVSRLGPPGESHNEDYNPLNAPRLANPPIEPRRTLYFRTWRGHLWVWLRPIGQRWVCYHSIWYRDGVCF